MFFQIVFHLAALSGGQVITARYDAEIGLAGYLFRSAGVEWAYFLVDPWLQDGGVRIFTGKNFVTVARPDLDDLLRRMDRPIVADIASGNTAPVSKCAEDDLAAGVTFWTLQWQSDERRVGDWTIRHKQAEHFLLKASHEGDEVQKSFASLAYAFSSLRSNVERVGFSQDATASLKERQDEHERRLKDTYDRFRESVPQRALRAASQLRENGLRGVNKEKWELWNNTIFREFSKYKLWNSYSR